MFYHVEGTSKPMSYVTTSASTLTTIESYDSQTISQLVNETAELSDQVRCMAQRIKETIYGSEMCSSGSIKDAPDGMVDVMVDTRAVLIICKEILESIIKGL